MKLKEAIGILNDMTINSPTYATELRVDALKLGIEALKRLHVLRLISTNEDAHWLPGETLE